MSKNAISEEAKENEGMTAARILPKGVTEEQITLWKETYGIIHQVTVSGAQLVIRSISYKEFSKIQESSTSQKSLTEALAKAGTLFCDHRPSAAGFPVGVVGCIAALSQVKQGDLSQLTKQLVEEEWDEAMENYDEDKRITKELVLEKLEKSPDLWVFFSPVLPILMTYIDQETYDKVVEGDPDTADLRMIQHSVVHPVLFSNSIRDLPYGLVLRLRDQVQVTSGFTPSSAVVL